MLKLFYTILFYKDLLVNRLVGKINQFLLNKSFAAAVAEAKKIKESTGQKVWVILWKGDFEAIPKQEFKYMWHTRTGMKNRTIQQWEKLVYEY